MDAKHLTFFKRTAELENMTKAADELMVSQPFLSRVIAELEKELGVELFDRIGRGIMLNSYGKVFYRRATNIFNEVEDAKKEIQDVQNSQQTLLTIVTNVSLYMPGLLKTIAQSHHSLKTRQLSAKKNNILKMLMNGEVDFAICCPPLEDNDEFITVPLRFEPGVIIYPEGHWLSDYSEISFQQIADETFIGVVKGYGTREPLDLFFQELGLTSKISIETNDTSSVFRYVSNGLGIALMPLSQVLREPIFKDNYVSLSNKAGADIALTWRRNQYISESRRLFIEKSKEYFGCLETYSCTPY